MRGSAEDEETDWSDRAGGGVARRECGFRGVAGRRDAARVHRGKPEERHLGTLSRHRMDTPAQQRRVRDRHRDHQSEHDLRAVVHTRYREPFVLYDVLLRHAVRPHGLQRHPKRRVAKYPFRPWRPLHVRRLQRHDDGEQRRARGHPREREFHRNARAAGALRVWPVQQRRTHQHREHRRLPRLFAQDLAQRRACARFRARAPRGGQRGDARGRGGGRRTGADRGR